MEIKMTEAVYPIVFSTDDNYAYYITVTIESLLETTNANQRLDIYILYEHLNPKSLHLFQSLCQERLTVTPIQIHAGDMFSIAYESDYFTMAMYYRLLIADLLPQYDKVLYIDCDIIFRKNVSKLFEIDLNGYVMGAVYEYMDQGLKDYLCSIGFMSSHYFNSGVLLINCSLFRLEQIAVKCMEQLKSNKKYKYPDQDILNIVCKGKVFPIPTEWNFKPFYSYSKKKLLGDDLVQYKLDRENPALIHYTSGFKPWYYPEKLFSELWWETAIHLKKTYGKTGVHIYSVIKRNLKKFQIRKLLHGYRARIMGKKNE